MSGICKLFGIPLAKVTQAEAVEKIIELAKKPRRPAHFVATLNVDFVCNAVPAWPFKGDRELWLYLRRSDFVVADGMPIVWLSRLTRNPLPERVTGSDGVPMICKRCAEEGLSIYVLGGRDVVNNEAFAKLREASPNLKIAGMDTSQVRLDEDQGPLLAKINAAKPDVLFVALGNPKEELWMGRNAPYLDTGVMIGVGGSFNFLAGLVPRAPGWMQRGGLEWVYRVYQEPKRLWKRYVYGLFKFSWLALRSIFGVYRDTEDGEPPAENASM